MQLGQRVKSVIRMINQNQNEKDPVLLDEQLRLADVTSAGNLRSVLVGIICQPKMAPPPPFYNNPSQNVQRLDRPVTATPVQPTPNSFVPQPSFQPAYPQPPYQLQPIPPQPVYQPAPAPNPFPQQPIPPEPSVVVTGAGTFTEQDEKRGTVLKNQLEKMDPQKVLSGEDPNDKRNQKKVNFFTRLFSSKS